MYGGLDAAVVMVAAGAVDAEVVVAVAACHQGGGTWSVSQWVQRDPTALGQGASGRIGYSIVARWLGTGSYPRGPLPGGR